jgi:hypothetical protein
VYCQTSLKDAARFPVDKMVDKSGDNPHPFDSMRDYENRHTQKTSCQNENQA